MLNIVKHMLNRSCIILQLLANCSQRLGKKGQLLRVLYNVKKSYMAHIYVDLSGCL